MTEEVAGIIAAFYHIPLFHNEQTNIQRSSIIVLPMYVSKNVFVKFFKDVSIRLMWIWIMNVLESNFLLFLSRFTEAQTDYSIGWYN